MHCFAIDFDCWKRIFKLNRKTICLKDDFRVICSKSLHATNSMYKCANTVEKMVRNFQFECGNSFQFKAITSERANRKRQNQNANLFAVHSELGQRIYFQVNFNCNGTLYTSQSFALNSSCWHIFTWKPPFNFSAVRVRDSFHGVFFFCLLLLVSRQRLHLYTMSFVLFALRKVHKLMLNIFILCNS